MKNEKTQEGEAKEERERREGGGVRLREETIEYSNEFSNFNRKGIMLTLINQTQEKRFYVFG